MPSKSITLRLINHTTSRAASSTEISIALTPSESHEQVLAKVRGRFEISIRSRIAIVDDDGFVLLPSYDNFSDGGTAYVVVDRTDQQARQEVQDFVRTAPRAFQLDDPAFPAETGMNASTPLKPRGKTSASSTRTSPQIPQCSPRGGFAALDAGSFAFGARNRRGGRAGPSPPYSPAVEIWDDKWGREEGGASDDKAILADEQFDVMLAKKQRTRREE